jgi:glyoxylase-like metal-dependent hydrolase (beta-lactamase superfamily II)
VVALDLDSVKVFFQIPSWPDRRGTLDLGNRVLDVIPIPGHEEHHIALYDRNTQLLLTGDALYPGLLFVSDFSAYRASVNRLAEFVEDHPVSHILGAHVEMKRARGKFFGYPHPFFQPDEHALQLEERHVFELRDAVNGMTAAPAWSAATTSSSSMTARRTFQAKMCED